MVDKMLVPIHQKVYQLYQSDTKIEATLEWIVGYIHSSFSKDVPSSLISLPDDVNIEVDIPEELVNDICSKFPSELSSGTIHSYVLLMAHILGGKE
jgi:hypothetical protein